MVLQKKIFFFVFSSESFSHLTNHLEQNRLATQSKWKTTTKTSAKIGETRMQTKKLSPELISNEIEQEER